jgi:hypothetical protein
MTMDVTQLLYLTNMLNIFLKLLGEKLGMNYVREILQCIFVNIRK